MPSMYSTVSSVTECIYEELVRYGSSKYHQTLFHKLASQLLPGVPDKIYRYATYINVNGEKTLIKTFVIFAEVSIFIKIYLFYKIVYLL